MNRFFLLPILAGGLLLSGCFTNPVTGRREIVAISPEQELSLGAQSFADVRKTEAISTDRAAIDRVDRVGQRIAQAVGNDLPGAKWEFVVFASEEVNAFALPGGHVGVYAGLLRLVTSDDELAMVIGHEIGHVTARHGAERMTAVQGLSMLGQLAAAGAEMKGVDQKYIEVFKQAYPGAVTVGAVLPHSRKQETEADHMGVVYAARAGYDPRAAISFWEKMIAHKNSGATSGLVERLLSSHPADRDRINALHALMPEVMGVYEANRRR